jgi:ribosomal protein S18 acetylase RimI-like enzyme
MGLMTEPQVVTLTAADSDRAIATVVSAFSTDPMARWFLRDQHIYYRYFPEIIVAVAGQSFALGSAFGVDGCSGVALWLPPGVSSDGESMATLFEKTTPVADREESNAFSRLRATYRLEEPHWHLAMLAVDPDRQANGYGSALLDHAESLLDAAGALSTLEATTLRSKALYERHGFEAQGRVQYGSSPVMWPMVRRPRG